MIVNPHPWTYSRSFATSVLSLGLVCIVAPSPGSHQVMGVLRQNQRFIQLFYTVGARLLTSYKILSEVAAHSCKVDMSISCLWVSCVTTRKLEQYLELTGEEEAGHPPSPGESMDALELCRVSGDGWDPETLTPWHSRLLHQHKIRQYKAHHHLSTETFWERQETGGHYKEICKITSGSLEGELPLHISI